MIYKLTHFISAQRVLSLDAKQVDNLQARKLRRTIQYAYDNVPYYRALFDKEGLKPPDVRTPADLAHIPISSKEDLLNADPADLISQQAEPSSLHEVSTSGSTGKPFTVRRTARDAQTRKIYDLRTLIAVGFRPLERLAAYTVRKNRSGSPSQQLLYRSKWISALEAIEAGVSELAAYDPDWLWTYPSTFRTLLEYTSGRLDSVCSPRAIVTGAERPDRFVRNSCEKLGIEHFNFYGAIEIGRIAWECRAHTGLHLNADNVVLEIIPIRGLSNVEDPTIGETIITTLNNEAMPLIRYRLGDLCSYLDTKCPCGIALPLITPPIGRAVDLVKLPSGQVLSARGLAAIIRRHQGVRQHQVRQTGLNQIEVQLVVDDSFSNEATSQMRSQLGEYLAEPINVGVSLVDSIKQSGHKARDFVSLVEER